MRANIPNVTKEQPNTPEFYSNMFLVRKCVRRWHPVIDLKTAKCTPQSTSLSYVHQKLNCHRTIESLGLTAWKHEISLFEAHGLSPQTVKGYRSCLASVLSHTDRATVLQDRIISDMASSMELERPRLGYSKPPYEPLQEASLKTDFLIAVASKKT